MSALAVAGLLLGMWHEGFAAPILCAATASLIFIRDFRKPATWTALAALGLGSVFSIISPPVLAIFSRDKYTWSYFGGSLSIIVYPYIFIGLLFIIMLAVRAAKTRTNPLKDPFYLITLIVTGTSAAIALITQSGPRAFMPGTVLSWLGIFRLMASDIRTHAWHRVAAGAIYLFLTIHLIVVDIICSHLRKEYYDTLAAWRENPSDTVFVHMTDREDAPWICLWKPHYNTFSHFGPVRRVCEFYFDSGSHLKAVPYELKDFTVEKAVKIDSDFGLMSYRNSLICPWDLDDTDAFVSWLRDDYGFGEKRSAYYCVPFTSPHDGKNYLWLHPNRSEPDRSIARQPRHVYMN